MLHKLKPVPRALVILGIVGGGVYAALNVPAVLCSKLIPS